MTPNRAALVLFAKMVCACTGGGQGDAIQGVWEVVERSYATPDTSWTNANPELGQYFFGAQYFSVQEIRESGPRPLFTPETSDAERLAAFDVFHAHSGTYTTDGSTLTIRPTLAKSPNSMDGSAYHYTYNLTGDRLTITRTVADESETRVTTLARIE